MKRTALVGWTLGIAALAFCAGRAGKLKFPYAGEALNSPCGKTMLEWRCETNSVRQDKPLAITNAFELISMSAKPSRKGLVVRANVRLREKVALQRGKPGWEEACRGACDQVYWLSQERFGEGRGYDTKVFHHWQHIAVGLSVDGKAVMQVVGGQHMLVKPKPSSGT